jgi:hypothetical protein
VLLTDYRLGFDIDFVIRQNLKYHGSVFSPKSTRLPEPWLEKLRGFANDLGYRFVLRQITFAARVNKDERRFEYTCWIENVGVAPIYHSYLFALKFTQGNRSYVHTSPANVTKWLPGDAFLREQIELPPSFDPGAVMIHAGLIHPQTHEPRVAFLPKANATKDGCSWTRWSYARSNSAVTCLTYRF